MRDSFFRLFVPVILITAMVSGGLPLSASENDGGPRGGFTLDDFEDGDLEGWATPPGVPFPCTITNDTIGANNSSRSLRMDGGSFAGAGTSHDFSGLSVGTLVYWVRSSSTELSDGGMFLSNEDGSDAIVSVIMADDGYFYATNSGSDYQLIPYEADTWYSVEIYIDWIGKTYGILINNNTVARNLGFGDVGAEDIGRIHFWNISDSTAWWDEIRYYPYYTSSWIMEDGFESADDTGWTSSSPALPKRLVLFSADGVSGPLGGRRGADFICATHAWSWPTGIPRYPRIQAFISVDSSDEIADFPTLYGVPTDRVITGPGTVEIATDWTDLLDGTIEVALGSAGVMDLNQFWYSGSNADGTVTDTTCSGWTDGSASFDGTYGWEPNTDSWWINRSEATCGTSSYRVLCVAWRQDVP